MGESPFGPWESGETSDNILGWLLLTSRDERSGIPKQTVQQLYRIHKRQLSRNPQEVTIDGKDYYIPYEDSFPKMIEFTPTQ